MDPTNIDADVTQNGADLSLKSSPCFKATLVTSSGIFLGDKPLQTTVPQLLFQIFTIFVSTRSTHALLRPLGIPQPISHVFAGMILGHSLLSRNETFRHTVFPLKAWVVLNMIALLSLSLYIFVIGVKTDLSVVHKSGKKGLAIATAGALLPYLSVISVSKFVSISFENHMLIRLASRWATTSNIVLACLLQEFNLLTSKLGRLAMSVTLINEVANLFVTSVYTAAEVSSDMKSHMMGLQCFVTTLGFLAVIIFVVRPLSLWLIRRTPEGGAMGEAYFVTMLVMVIALGLAGELIGQHSTTGPLLLGLLLPGGPPLGTTLVVRLERVLSGLFIPIYFAISGFKTTVVAALTGGRATGYTLLLVAVSVVTKFVGVLVVCLHNRMPFAEALVVTLMMSCKGIMEYSYFNIWQESSGTSVTSYFRYPLLKRKRN